MKQKPLDKAYLCIIHLLVTISITISLLFLASHLPLADVLYELLVVVGNPPLNLVDAKLANETLEDVTNLDFEMVRVLVGPVDQRGNELLQRCLDVSRRERNNGDLDVTDRRANDLAVGGGEEDDEGGEELLQRCVGDCV